MDGGRENVIEMRAGAWLNGLSGGIAVPVGIASGPLLDKDGSKVCRILGLYWVFTYVAFFVRLDSYESRIARPAPAFAVGTSDAASRPPRHR